MQASPFEYVYEYSKCLSELCIQADGVIETLVEDNICTVL